jgi:methoxymalonate biosynthesis acyl carrier protein
MPFEQDIRRVLSEKMYVEVASPDADLLSTGVLDSLALIQLLVHLEDEFGVKIALDQIEIEDLRSTYSIARLIARTAMAART